MLRLMKYEYRKTLTSKLIFLGVLALGELFFLAGLMLNRNVAFPLEMNDNSLFTIGIITLFISSIVIMVFVTFESAFNLYREFNSKEGYMLFMTPRTMNQILGSKILVGVLNIAIVGLFIMGLAVLDFFLLGIKQSGFQEFMNQLGMVISRMTEININWNFFLSVGIGTMANLIFAMSCGALAVVVGHLVGIERGFLKGLVTFIIYMVVSNIGSLLLYKIVTKTFVSLDNGNILGQNIFVSSALGMSSYPANLFVTTQYATAIGSIILSACIYIITLWLMEKKVSL